METRKASQSISTARNALALAIALLLWIEGSPRAHAAIALSPVNQGSVDNSTSPMTVYFPIKGAGTCSAALTNPAGKAIDSTAASPGLEFQISTSNDLGLIGLNQSGAVVSSTDVSIHVEGTNNTQIALVGPYTSSVNSAYFVPYGTTSGASVTFSISLPDTSAPNPVATGLCTFLTNTLSGSCQPGAGVTPVNVLLTVGVVKTGSTFSASSNADTTTVNVVLADCPPNTSTSGPQEPRLSLSTTPGDQRVTVHNNSAAVSDVIPVTGVVIYGDTGNGVSVNSPIQQYIQGTGAGDYQINSLTNDQPYCFGMSFVNAASFVTTTGNWDSGLPNPVCATPSQIAGFLPEGKCFIATAAYGSQWDPRLSILRQFRNKVLARSALGRAIRDWYFSWSPPAAYWLLDHPWARGVVRVFLYPLVGFARLALWVQAGSAARLAWSVLVLLLALLGTAWAIGQARPRWKASRLKGQDA